MIVLKKARLKNFIGNLKGTKTEEVIINFNESGVINFQGKNGSGKTSTLRLLHPYSDGKEELIIDKEASTDDKIVYIPAEKELDYLVNGQEAKVKVIYSKAGTKKCFLSIDGVEQNANGNTTSFNTLVEQLFGFADDLLSNRLVTTVKSNNFLELTPIQRKTEISALLPNIEKYVEAYKIVNEKVKSFNLRIKFLVAEINSLSGLSDLEKLLESYKENLNKNNELLDEYLNICNSKKTIISNISAEINFFKEKYKFSDVVSLCNSLFKTIENKKAILQQLSNESSTYITGYEDILKGQIRILEQDLNRDRNNQDELMQKLRGLYDEINEIVRQQNELKSLDSTINNIEKTLDDEKKYKDSLESDNTKANSLEKVDNSKGTKEKFTYLFTQINTLINIMSGRGISEEQIDSYERTNEEYINDSRSLVAMENNYNNLQGTNTAYMSMIKMADEFDNKLGDLKSSCDLASCKDTIVGKSVEVSGYMNDIFKDKENLKKSIEDRKYFIDNVIPVLTLINIGINHLFPILGTGSDFYKRILKAYEMIQDYNTKVASYEKAMSQITYTNNILDNVNEKIRSLEYQLDGVQKRKVELLESIKFVNLDSIFNQRKQEAEEVNSTIEKLKLNVNNLSKSLTNTKDELQKFLDRPNEVILNNEISTLESDYEKINSLLTKMNEAQIDANTYVEKYNAYFSNKESIQKSITETETLINVINRYSNEYTDLNNKIVSYNKILEALHISKGLPSIISSKILAVIQDDCNDMIKIMFKEQFAINFVNTEKELSLMVFNSYNGEISEYNMLSGGEQSIIKMVLSLSLLKFKIGEASSSILRLDEIDAFLDDENRQSFDLFLDLLMSEKGVNQLFLISHNVSLSGQRVSFDKENKTIRVFNTK